MNNPFNYPYGILNGVTIGFALLLVDMHFGWFLLSFVMGFCFVSHWYFEGVHMWRYQQPNNGFYFILIHFRQTI